MVKAGLSEKRLLSAFDHCSCIYVEAFFSYGTIEKGKVASLVFLISLYSMKRQM